MTLDLATWMTLLLDSQSPALPDITVMRVARYLSWALVLAWLTLYATRSLSRPIQRGAAAVVLVWTLLPGPVSPAFWLGLAFQMPSLMSTLLCVQGGLWLMRDDAASAITPAQRQAFDWAGLMGIVLGWVLLLDTFALLPLSGSVYAWGFTPGVLLLIAGLACLPWVWQGPASAWRGVSVLLWSALVLFVLLRLPTGNVWDVLLDPVLWLVLQARAAQELLRRIRTGSRATTTPA